MVCCAGRLRQQAGRWRGRRRGEHGSCGHHVDTTCERWHVLDWVRDMRWQRRLAEVVVGRSPHSRGSGHGATAAGLPPAVASHACGTGLEWVADSIDPSITSTRHARGGMYWIGCVACAGKGDWPRGGGLLATRGSGHGATAAGLKPACHQHTPPPAVWPPMHAVQALGGWPLPLIRPSHRHAELIC